MFVIQSLKNVWTDLEHLDENVAYTLIYYLSLRKKHNNKRVIPQGAASFLITLRTENARQSCNVKPNDPVQLVGCLHHYETIDGSGMTKNHSNLRDNNSYLKCYA